MPLPCRGGDPTCPCQDGDVCHYVDDPVTGTKAMASNANELPIAREVLEGLVQPGERHYRVEVGPSADAVVVDVRFDGQTLTLVYDRPIVVPRLTGLYP